MLIKSALVAVIVLTATSCKSSFLGFGATPAEASKQASDGLQSHALRFDDVVRDTKFTESRAKISRFALTPSRIYNDSSVWNTISVSDSSRALTLNGTYDDVRGGYTFRAAAPPSAPNALGDSRHMMRLELEADGAYAWDTSVDQTIGTMPATYAGRALSSIIASAESPTARDLRSESVLAFPRTARALGRLFSIDSARSIPLTDGSSATSLAVRWHSDRIRGTMPNFAVYVAKYIEPSTYGITLSDRRGQTYLQVRGAKGALLVRWRSRGGRLLPLEGGSGAMPDTMRIRLDFNAKYKVFRVGFAELIGDFIVQRGAHSAAWMLRFRQEPKWQLPLFTETLIRTPLRRPFQGRGSELYLALRDDVGPQTLLVRTTHTEVKESAILRWMGSLGATAMSDFQGRAEAEENRFLSEAFTALRADVHDVLGGIAPKEASP
ncbi:MAG: hypothetical protein ACREOG_23395 [Gemmatimonadaceae bacterium]